MNKRLTLQYFSLLIFFFVSCTYEIVDVYESEDESSVDLSSELTTIKVSISDETSTKTYISDDTGENGSNVKIFWSQYDYINVRYGEGSYNFKFKEYDENNSSAYFLTSSQLPELESNTIITAEYPHTGKADLSQQYGTLNNLYLYHYMTADYNVVDDDCSWDDVSFEFITQTPILKLTLKNEAFKGQLVENIQFIIGNNLIVNSLSKFSASEETGEITVYFAIDPKEINNNTSITAVCNGVTYESKLSSSTMLSAGNLYRINKVMNVADVVMKYSNGQAIISVFDESAIDAVSAKVVEALADGYTDIVISGSIIEDVVTSINNILINKDYNTILTVDGTKTFYVYDEAGFLSWGASAENDRRSNCTLINNIDLTCDWEYYIGTYSTNYSGTLNGNNHIIRGLSINQDALRLQYYYPIALISYSSGVVKNLIIEGGRCICNTADVASAALVVGQNNGIVDGVRIRSDVSGKNVYFKNSSSFNSIRYVGVIVNTNVGVVKNCTNELPVIISTPEDLDLYAGGIVAANINYIVQCINDGDIKAEIEPAEDKKHYIGGIVGNISDNKWYNTKIYLCANRGKVNGGIAGYGASASGSFVGNYTTYGNLIYSAFYYPDITDCYTTDVDLEGTQYYVSSLITVYDRMNTAVENLQCEYIDKKWIIDNGYLELETK